MRRRLTISLSLLAAMLVLPSAAPAATTFGDECAGNPSISSGSLVVFNISAPGNPLPLAAPGDGVITSWTVRLHSTLAEPIQQSLKVIRAAGPATTAQLVGEASGAVQAKTNVFPARIPVRAGDWLGLTVPSPGLPIACYVATEATMLGFYENMPPVPVGGTFETTEQATVNRIPVSAALEPDADHDGYGDETQDECPANAAVHAACPVVAAPPPPAGAPLVLDSLALPGKGSKVVVYVAASAAVPVTVSGSARLPRRAGKRKRGAGKRRARAAKRRTRAAARVKLPAVTKAASPGRLTRFAIPLPRRMKRELRRGKKVRVELAASATDSAGRQVSDAAKLKLKSAAKSGKRSRRGRR